MIDRYLLAQVARPLVVSLAVVLVALLLERVLRLFDLLAQSGGPLPMVVELAAALVPHYLGLALPASFFIGIFVVMARLSDDNEIDALLATGVSIAQVTRPLVLAGVALTLFSLALFGYVQPYSRYAYRALLHAATHAGWDARAQPTTFNDAGGGFTLSADFVDSSGRNLTGVFLRRIKDGQEQITTAATGTLSLSADREHLLLTLHNGVNLRQLPGETPDLIHFEDAQIDRPFQPEAPPFRARGDGERELTLDELWTQMHDPDPVIKRSRLRSELHARLARAVSLPLLPLLGVPLAMAAKRGKRGAGLVIAAAILVLYHHAALLGESLGDTGKVSAVLSNWIPFAVFAAFCIYLFRASQQRPGDTPFTRLIDRVERFTSGLRRKPAAVAVT